MSRVTWAVLALCKSCDFYIEVQKVPREALRQVGANVEAGMKKHLEKFVLHEAVMPSPRRED